MVHDDFDLEESSYDLDDEKTENPVKITNIEVMTYGQMDVPVYSGCTLKEKKMYSVELGTYYVYTVALNQPYTEDIANFYSIFEESDNRIASCMALMENGEPVYDSLEMALLLQNGADNECTRLLKAEMKDSDYPFLHLSDAELEEAHASSEKECAAYMTKPVEGRLQLD